MAEYTDREHYIPLRKSDLVELLCRDKGLTPADRDGFRQFCQLVASIYHFEYHQKLESLKDEYAPFDPDAVTKQVNKVSAEDRAKRLDGLFDEFSALLEKANYRKLEKKDIEEAMEGASGWGLNMEVDFAVFEKIVGFVRGDVMGKRTKRHLLKFWQVEEVELPVYQRLAFMLKMRPHKRLGKDVNTEGVYLKLFKDIPKMDLEMLLPGARLQMPGFTKLKMGGSLLSGLAYIVYSIVRQLLAAAVIGVAFFWAPVAALLGYGYKQWYGYQVTKQTYTLQLTQSLYYQTLDNNSGVLFHLLDEAEEQECREAMLAYYYLWRYAGERGWTARDLDDYVEMDLERLADLKVDFEIEDAMAKLEKLGIVEKSGDRYRAVPLAQALETLDRTWDNYFKYHQPESEKAVRL